MNRDELLRQLADILRERVAEADEQGLDELWDRLSAGELSASERATLDLRVQSDPTLAAAWEAFRPLGEDFQADVTARILAAQRGDIPDAATAVLQAGTATGADETGAAAGADAPATADLPGGGEVAVDEPPARDNVVQLHPRRPSWLPAALAAGVAVFAVSMLLRVAETPLTLPQYTIQVDGAVEGMRSFDPAPRELEPAGGPTRPPTVDAPLRFVAGNVLRVVLTPETAVDGDVAARAFLDRDGGIVQLPVPRLQVSDTGAVRFQGEVGADLDLPGGRSDLLIVVAGEDDLPTIDALTGSRRGWQQWRIPIQVDSPPGDD